MKLKQLLCLCLLSLVGLGSHAQIKILFDNVKGETSGVSSDWTVDADLHNMNWGTAGTGYTCGSCFKSNPQKIPTAAQSGITASTAENYWKGALSAWGVDLAKRGYIIESLPYTGAITYGNSSNLQDLSHYKVFVMCEPNTRLTIAEKTALVQFVLHGGGLFMISDHNISDRNNDGWDSPHIWQDFAASTGNPFGIFADTLNFSGTFTNLPVRANDSILHGVMGNATGIKFYNGTSFTLSPSANPSVTGDIYRSGTTGNTGALVAHSYYGLGKVAAVGDSSPFDDGTGNDSTRLYVTYATDLGGNVRKLIMNITIWLASTDSSSSTAVLSLNPAHGDTVCLGQSTTLTALGATSYTWSPGGTTSASITVSPTTTTTYTVSGMVNGSPQTLTSTVTVLNKPVAGFTITLSGAFVQIGNQTQNVGICYWNFGDQTAIVTGLSPTHSYTHNGNYTITLIATNRCGNDTSTHAVTINVAGISESPEGDGVKMIQNGNDITMIYPPSSTIGREVHIYNMSGQEVLTDTSHDLTNPLIISIAGLSRGMYILKTTGLTKTFSK